MEIKKIDTTTYEADGAQVWVTDGTPRCVDCSGPLVAMSQSCRHALAVKRVINKSWVCKSCGFKNNGRNNNCLGCQTKRPQG